MKRPWQISIIFAAFLIVVMGAMAWITQTVLRLEKTNAEIQHLAATEEIVRLALWRMDSAVSPMIVQESSRPYFEYNPYNKVATVFPNAGIDTQNKVIPSPLLTQTNRHVNLYFQYDQEEDTVSNLGSPQVLPKDLNTWAGDNWNVNNDTDGNPRRLDEFASNVNLPVLTENLSIQQAEQIPAQQAQIANLPNQSINALPVQQSTDQQLLINDSPVDTQQQESYQREGLKNSIEYMSRARNQKKISSKIKLSKQQFYGAQQVSSIDEPKQEAKKPKSSKKKPSSRSWNSRRSRVANEPLERNTTTTKEVQEILATNHVPVVKFSGNNAPKVEEDVMSMSWNGAMLVMARKVEVDGQGQIQGAWLNWESLRTELLEEVSDILPDAKLVPADPKNETDQSRLLAYLPAKLIPGEPANPPQILASPLIVPLSTAWICVIAAAAAIGLLLRGTVVLSERRGAFVSAVTHELRTPLTTFKMYSEMLASGMITDDAKRQEYLETLHSESSRLGHLVENVLAYARLEKGTGARVIETTTPSQIINRCQTRLVGHAKESDMDIIIEDTDSTSDREIKTDPHAIEQILFNLVDNACKYARRAEDKRIHLSVIKKGNKTTFRVCDHGQGLNRQEISQVFKPFRKSAKKAAQSAPGVGLGLALCKNLARQLGGDLVYENHPDKGACFALNLPS